MISRVFRHTKHGRPKKTARKDGVPVKSMNLDGAMERTADMIAEGGEKFSRMRKRYLGGNPLLVRKKFSMKDVYFRKDDPDAELFRLELGFDWEFCAVAVALVLVLVFLMRRMAAGRKRAAEKREWKRRHRQ